jgi:UDP-2,4-diacetamido-2,4,6-trideoxy-beta-L-altropyranose hydrolase
MRCLTLADTLNEAGWRCALAVRPGTFDTVPGLAQSGHDTFALDEPAPSEPAALAARWPQGCDLLVADHYGRDAAWELAIDDLADREHDCDVLLDQNLGRKADDYEGLVPPTCRLLMGPEYALLRPQFAAARAAALARRKGRSEVERILMNLGATDPQNATGMVLEGIKRSGIKADLDVVLGAGAPHLEEVRALAENLPQPTRVHVDARDVAPLMAAADLAIGAAGTSSWERCCLGLPSLLVVIADNQRTAAAALEAAGAARLVGWHADCDAVAVAAQISSLVAAPEARARMSARAAEVCDGRGSLRALMALLPPEPAAEGVPVTLRLASSGDSDIMFTWQSDERTRRFARTPEPPSLEEHETWLRSCLADPQRILALILHDEAPAGMLRLDRLTTAGRPDEYEVSIVIAPDKYRRGIATAALALGRKLLPRARLYAEVLPDNEASHALFRRAGFRMLDPGRYLNETTLRQ